VAYLPACYRVKRYVAPEIGEAYSTTKSGSVIFEPNEYWSMTWSGFVIGAVRAPIGEKRKEEGEDYGLICPGIFRKCRG